MEFLIQQTHTNPSETLSIPSNLRVSTMVCLKDPLIQHVCQLFDKISKLGNLNPSKEVDSLFTELVNACLPPYPIDVTELCSKIQEMRKKLILLCGQAEGLMEKHFSAIIGSYENPLAHLDMFTYYTNYVKLGKLEFNLLSMHCSQPARMAFIGSGSLPLTSIVLATLHLTSTIFHNYDMDESANKLASRLVESDPDLSKRMSFFTRDVMTLSAVEFREYDVVFLAALVGMEIEEKMVVIKHLANNMAPGAILMLRSAHGARAFLYPVVEPRHLQGFDVISVFHPTDEVVNSVVIARRSYPLAVHCMEHQPLMNCGKCAEIQSMKPLINQMNKMEEVAIHEDHCH